MTHFAYRARFRRALNRRTIRRRSLLGLLNWLPKRRAERTREDERNAGQSHGYFLTTSPTTGAADPL